LQIADCGLKKPGRVRSANLQSAIRNPQFPMPPPIKLSSPATKEFWEIPVLHEDAQLLAVDKPVGLLVSPDRSDAARPSLLRLLNEGIVRGVPWARERGLAYLANAHRMGFENSGVLLLAKSKPILVALAGQSGAARPVECHVALVRGSPEADEFTVAERVGRHQFHSDLMRVDPVRGKPCSTKFTVLERFKRWTLLKCQPLTGGVDHQIRVHLSHADLSVAGDAAYGGKQLLLSTFKTSYRLKPGQEERPLISALALHAESLSLAHPVTGTALHITAPWPRDLRVAVKYLRLYAQETGGA